MEERGYEYTEQTARGWDVGAPEGAPNDYDPEEEVKDDAEDRGIPSSE